jgi:flagellar biosynthesis protein
VKKNRMKEAAALKHEPEKDRAPKVMATGKGSAAEKILDKAEEYGVPVYEDEELAHFLTSMDIGSEIPPELYQVVAEILVFINNLDRTRGERNG